MVEHIVKKIMGGGTQANKIVGNITGNKSLHKDKIVKEIKEELND